MIVRHGTKFIEIERTIGHVADTYCTNKIYTHLPLQFSKINSAIRITNSIKSNVSSPYAQEKTVMTINIFFR